jgi:hypothetical protein
MRQARTSFFALNPSLKEKAEIDFWVAKATLKTWNERAADDGESKQSRLDAMKAMEAYHKVYKLRPEAAGLVVQAAYHVFKMRLAGKDHRVARDWAKAAVTAFEKHKASSPVIDAKRCSTAQTSRCSRST